ncbi:hypothetical protein E2562_011389 [Oryza meyeriana var. granulata]|uniref:Aminotransferase-like plant mobile domain-containing protein n=1 Tax=Oryza meyeriana var. granulata TaxID=110450 RepID=A0A6G1EB42_9ORYZ|nr:hypothetical protein E2562_011389 [Oryza meyeriana var. granulata]
MANIEKLLIQESTVPIVSDGDPSRPAVRSAHFLLPRAGVGRLPTLPSPRCNAGPVLGDGLRVEFKGWAGSRKLWRRVRRGEGTLVQLAAFWSGDTNTFMFPWDEATVTLEDMAVLGGLPLFGKPVRARLPDAVLGDVDALKAVRSALNGSTYKKPTYAGWAKYFLERPQEEEATGGGETAGGLIEHGAFLAMWLSLFVFAAPPFDVVRPQEAFQMRAPMHILLLWVWERFPELRPDMASTTPGTDARRVPRATRWHDVHKALDPRMY